MRIRVFCARNSNVLAITKKTEGVGETRDLADALESHPEPGRRGITALR